jgi:signal transduction histidine kinase
LAAPFNPEGVGINHTDDQDPNGVYVIQEFFDVAKRGNGFVYGVIPDPAQNMTSKLKLIYVMKVNDEWFLGSGIYWPEA